MEHVQSDFLCANKMFSVKENDAEGISFVNRHLYF